MLRGSGSSAAVWRARLIAAALVASATSLGLAAAPASAEAKQDRFSLAGGCWSLAPIGGPPSPAATKLRLKATRLGSYMLYTTDGRYLAASGGGVSRVATPSAAADWEVRKAPRGSFTLSPASDAGSLLVLAGEELATAPRESAGGPARVRFVAARGCAVYPEAELNVSGPPRKGPTRYGEVAGLLDAHMHWMNFEYIGGNFRCGRPWHRFGIERALPDCSEVEGPLGVLAPLQGFFNGTPGPRDTRGYPQLTEWRRDNLTYEGTYYRWMERAWRAGLKLMVMPTNDNRILCELMPNRRHPCDEWAVNLKQINNMYVLQDYVDAQAGGPGKGFFQIVKNPFEARRVINRGQMAVVLEIETSEIFNCSGVRPENCTREAIDDGLRHLKKIGVRSAMILNKFDTPLAGVRYDGGPLGLIINLGNRASYGRFWDAGTCDGPERDNTIENAAPAGPLVSDVSGALGIGGGTLPAYPDSPHCNKIGLTGAGKYMIRRMTEMNMIVNPDHMSQAAVDDTLSIAEARRYSGVISPHGWIDPRNWPRIYQLGGMAFPSAGSAEGFVRAWRTYRPKRTPHFFGWGYGADLGGLAAQPPGTPPGDPASVRYPFRSLDGAATVRRQRTGEREFDFPTEGVAHYGLYPEWYEEVRRRGGGRIAADMLRGPEAYLQMWERSVGVPAGRCMRPGLAFERGGLGRIRLGMSSRRLLERTGQPVRRSRAWTYCVRGERGRRSGQTAVLTPKGRVAMVASTAQGQRAGGVSPGAPARLLRGRARALGKGVWTRRAGSSRLVYEVRGGVVRKVAVATRRGARSLATIRANLRRVPMRVERRPARLETRASNSVGPRHAVPLSVQEGSPQFPMSCLI